MKNKKGFTLLELLAVIVLLAIIALIAVPIILNMIENAKTSAAVDSAYGYIEAVENYQAYEMLKGNPGLKEGLYNITEDTTIDNVKYKKLKDLVKLKGSAPTFGRVGITKNGTVGTADLCINDYLILYQNNKAEILSGGCENLGITLAYNISSENWEASKTLEILYPEGSYKYYYKLESGKAKIGDNEVVVGQEIESATNIVNIELLENSKITAWMLKNGEKISLRTYEETKIDNVEIGVPSAEIVTGYPTITEYGVKVSSNLTITYEEQEGTSPYYSVDGGEWKKYNGITPVLGTKVQVKLVREKSGRSGEIVDAVLSGLSPTDAVTDKTYDGDETSHLYTYGNKSPGVTYYINVDSSMQGQKIKYVHGTSTGDTAWSNLYSISADGTETKLVGKTGYNKKWTEEVTIPNDCVKLAARGFIFKIIEFDLLMDPTYSVEKVYPKLTATGVNEEYYYNVSISYYKNSSQKLYRINDGDWQNYSDKKIKLNIGDKLELQAKIKDNNTKIIVFEAEDIADRFTSDTYDGDETTYLYTYGNKSPGVTYYIDVDSSIRGKTIKYVHGTSTGDTAWSHLYSISADGTETKLLGQTGYKKTWTEEVTIPNDCVKLAARGFIFKIIDISVVN